MESHSPMRSQDRMDNLRCFWIALAVLKFEVLLTCQSLSISIDYYWLLIKLIVIHKIEPGKHNILVLLHFSYRLRILVVFSLSLFLIRMLTKLVLMKNPK